MKIKKLLAIMVLGLLLSGCSETNDNKKLTIIENCADTELPRTNKKATKEILSKTPLKKKLTFGDYTRIFSACEDAFKKNPETIKAKYK